MVTKVFMGKNTCHPSHHRSVIHTYHPEVSLSHQYAFPQAILENREFKKWKFSFFPQRHALSTSFEIFVVTYGVTNFLPKLTDMLLFSTEKTEFPFLVFPYFWVMPFPPSLTAFVANI